MRLISAPDLEPYFNFGTLNFFSLGDSNSTSESELEFESDDEDDSDSEEDEAMTTLRLLEHLFLLSK
jgi:hypothetical protein